MLPNKLVISTNIPRIQYVFLGVSYKGEALFMTSCSRSPPSLPWKHSKQVTHPLLQVFWWLHTKEYLRVQGKEDIIGGIIFNLS